MQNNRNKLIFIIDDSVDNQTLLKLLFTSKGYDVHCACNGEEALGLLKELSYLPDLILLDAQMPVMDGYQFRIEQQKFERLKNIPVVIMTGDEDEHMSRNMLKPLGILIKPLQIQSVSDSVSWLLSPKNI